MYVVDDKQNYPPCAHMVRKEKKLTPETQKFDQIGYFAEESISFLKDEISDDWNRVHSHTVTSTGTHD